MDNIIKVEINKNMDRSRTIRSKHKSVRAFNKRNKMINQWILKLN